MTTYSIGAAGKSNALSALYEVDFDPDIPYLVGEEGKLAKFLQATNGTEDLHATSADWAYSQHRDAIDTTAASALNTDLAIKVTNINQWAPNDVMMFSTGGGETAIVNSVDTSTSFVTLAARQRGSIAKAAVTSGDEVINLGPAYDDGASIVSARMVVDTKTNNYVQLFWENVEFDGTTLAINDRNGVYGGDFVTRKRKEKLLELMQKQDFAHLFGEAVETGTQRTMGGIVNFVASTESATIATLTEIGFEQHLETKGLLQGADNKLAVTSSKLAGGMNRWATAKFAINNVGGTEYGYMLRDYDTPLGSLKVMPHYNLSSSTAQNGKVIIVDLTHVKRCALRPLKLYVDIDVGTRDAKMDAWLGQITAKWGHPRHHSLIKGVTAITA